MWKLGKLLSGGHIAILKEYYSSQDNKILD